MNIRANACICMMLYVRYCSNTVFSDVYFLLSIIFNVGAATTAVADQGCYSKYICAYVCMHVYVHIHTCDYTGTPCSVAKVFIKKILQYTMSPHRKRDLKVVAAKEKNTLITNFLHTCRCINL